jgi:Eukaryotic cytochrome b561
MQTAVAAFGWYVIYSNKELYGRPHLITTHGQLGAAVIIGYLLLGVFGAFALNPDWGIFKGNTTVRLAHKLGGRVLTALAWLSSVLGFYAIEPSLEVTGVFTVPLFLFGLFVLL